MQTTVTQSLPAAATAVRTAVANAFVGHDKEATANEAVASASPVVALAEGLEALWARATSLNQAGLDALASAAHHVTEAGFWGRSGRASAVLVALATAPNAAGITGGPAADPRFVADPA